MNKLDATIHVKYGNIIHIPPVNIQSESNIQEKWNKGIKNLFEEKLYSNTTLIFFSEYTCHYMLS